LTFSFSNGQVSPPKDTYLEESTQSINIETGKLRLLEFGLHKFDEGRGMVLLRVEQEDEESQEATSESSVEEREGVRISEKEKVVSVRMDTYLSVPVNL